METGHIDTIDMMKGGFTLFEFKRFGLHLKEETIILHSDIQDVAENLALAFSACILYVLCEPRFDPPGVVSMTSNLKPMGHAIPMFVAMGYSTETPCNSLLYWRYRERRLADGGDSPACEAGGAEGDEGYDEGQSHDDNQHFDPDQDYCYCPWDPFECDYVKSSCCDVCDATGIADTAGCGGCGSDCKGWGGSSCADGGGDDSSSGGDSSYGNWGSSCGGGDAGGSMELVPMSLCAHDIWVNLPNTSPAPATGTAAGHAPASTLTKD